MNSRGGSGDGNERQSEATNHVCATIMAHMKTLSRANRFRRRGDKAVQGVLPVGA
jgi:hypothetical protein